MGGTPKWNLFIKLCTYSYMFNLQSPSKNSSFDAIHLSRHFFHCSKQFLNSSVLMPFSASAKFLVSPLRHLQNVSLWELFSSEKQKSHLDKVGWIRRVGSTRLMMFLVKNCWTLSDMWAGIFVNHPSWNGQIHWSQTHPLTTMPAGTLIQIAS